MVPRDESGTSCPDCNREMLPSLYDITVTLDDGEERHYFGLAGESCPPCGNLRLDRETVRLLHLRDVTLVAAIESDQVLLQAGHAA